MLAYATLRSRHGAFVDKVDVCPPFWIYYPTIALYAKVFKKLLICCFHRTILHRVLVEETTIEKGHKGDYS